MIPRMEDITPKYLRDEVRFKDKFRGYDPDEVDELIDRIADHLERLDDQLRRAQHALAQRPQAPAPAPAPAQVPARPAPEPAPVAPRVTAAAPQPAYDEEARQILVLAQRTASEARREARDQATKIVSEAEARAAAARADSDEQIRTNAERAQRQLRTDIEVLSEHRRALQVDVAELQRHAAETRSVLTKVLEGQLERLGSLRDEKLPTAPVLNAGPSESLPPAPAAVPPVSLVAEVAASSAPPTRPAPPVAQAYTEAAPPPPPPIQQPVAKAPVAPAPVAEVGAPAVEPSPRPTHQAAEWNDDVSDPDDPWLAELQRARTDQTPLGPRDFEAEGFLLDSDDDSGRRGLFRRR